MTDKTNECGKNAGALQSAKIGLQKIDGFATFSGRNHLSSVYFESAFKGVFFAAAVFAAAVVLFILLFLLKESVLAFNTINITDFLFGSVWNPTGANASYGTMPLWIGTILATLGATVIAAPLGIACAVYLTELAPKKVRAFVLPAVEFLSGIPSVVYGFFGLIVLTDFLRIVFDVPSGESWLAASILLGIMALPTIISISENALSSVPNAYRDGSLGLGATHWQTISKVLLPAAFSGITAAVILGMGRAIGETMAVLMVCGNAAVIPDPIINVLSPIKTLTAALGIEIGEAAVGSEHYYALFGVVVLLLIISLAINLSAKYILKRLSGQNDAGITLFRKSLKNKSPKNKCIIENKSENKYKNKPGNKSENKFKNKSKNKSYFNCKIANTIKKNLPAFAAILFLIVCAAAIGITAAVVSAAVICVYLFVYKRLSVMNQQKIAFFELYVAVAIVLFAITAILFDIVSHGLPALSWEFLTQSPSSLGREGGIFPAIAGTLLLCAGAVIFAVPIGVCAAVYLNEYSKSTYLSGILRTGVDLLNATPSIVFGLFGFSFLVIFLNFGISLIAGQITLGLMILPTIIRTTEESLKSVPQTIRDASLALGATHWQTIKKIAIPPALPGIITGVTLSLGRAAGETAPIMFTAVVFSSRFLPSDIFSPVMALPYHLYILSTNVPGAEVNQYGTALVLVILVSLMYLATMILRHHYQRSIRW